MNEKINAPILLIAFNRPDTTQVVFNKIRELQPRKLYVAIDGPRTSKVNEATLCKNVEEITKNVDWECDAHYLIREKNLGCKHAVSGAISWVFEKEESVIILEDDIVPSLSFFTFAEEMLIKYATDDRIVMISGNNYTPLQVNDADYLFSKYGHIWGWATWKRAWAKFDVNVPDIHEAINSNLSGLNFTSSNEKRFYLNYFKSMQKRVIAGSINAWGPQYTFYRFNNNLLSIVPKVNLCSNIGVESSREEASTIQNSNSNYYPADNNFIVKKHPDHVFLNVEYDRLHFKNHINNRKSPIWKRIFKKIKGIIPLNNA